MQIDISELILLCALQTFGLLIILSQRKFRSAPNNILIIILTSLLVYYAYYFFFFGNVEMQQYTPLFLSFTFISPPIIYFYCISVIKGRLPSFQATCPHAFLPLFSLIWSYIVWKNGSTVLQDFTLKITLVILGLMHIVYPLYVVFHLGNLYQLKGVDRIRVFKYNKEKTIMVKLFVSRP